MAHESHRTLLNRQWQHSNSRCSNWSWWCGREQALFELETVRSCCENLRLLNLSWLYICLPVVWNYGEIEILCVYGSVTHGHTYIYLQWIPLNIIPSVHPLFMILSGIFHYPGTTHIYMRYENCACAYFTTCRVQVATYTRVSGVYEHLLVHTERSSRAIQSWMCRIEFILVVFAVYLPLVVRSSNAIMMLMR